jgi:hypothetical protein
MTNPLFMITGCPRSGTTLLRRILDAHPDIAIGPKYRGILRRYERREGLTPEGFVTSEMAERGKNFRFLAPGEFADIVRRALAGPGPVHYGELVSRVLDRYAELHGKTYVGHKVGATGHNTPGRVRLIPALHGIFPEAKFVHIIRDGRDVALSVTGWRKGPALAERFPTWAHDPYTTAAVWWEWQVRGKRADAALLPSGRYAEVRYEQLVGDPGRTCAELCAFLGVRYDERMLRFHEGREVDDPALDAKHAWRPVTSGLRDWRTQMTRADQELFEAAAGGLLDELGYARAFPAPSAQAREHAARVRASFEAAVS